ncbi:MAG: hypothetical protein LBG92_00530 [Prevotellaceae bacterium]|jgi:hypothetical protein|nr:hypothetical protein [Prevotellaceae bacterium]
MKNKLFIACVISIVFLLFACESKKGNFAKERNIVFTNLNIGESIGRINDMKVTDNYLVITGENMEGQILMIDKRDNKMR